MEHNTGEFFGAILHSRDIAHLMHLSTKSYAAHNALNEYYDSIIPLIDNLIECYQGCYGLVEITIPASKSYDDYVQYFMDLKEYVMTERDACFDESYLVNITDEIIALISKTVYKLKFLK